MKVKCLRVLAAPNLKKKRLGSSITTLYNRDLIEREVKENKGMTNHISASRSIALHMHMTISASQ